VGVLTARDRRDRTGEGRGVAARIKLSDYNDWMKTAELMREIFLIVVTGVASYYFGVKKTRDEIAMQEGSRLRVHVGTKLYDKQSQAEENLLKACIEADTTIVECCSRITAETSETERAALWHDAAKSITSLCQTVGRDCAYLDADVSRRATSLIEQQIVCLSIAYNCMFTDNDEPKNSTLPVKKDKPSIEMKDALTGCSHIYGDIAMLIRRKSRLPEQQ
jgi:hypothetical protein